MKAEVTRGFAAPTQALDLTIGLGYVERLLANSHIEKYMAKHHIELLNEFKKSRTIPDPIRKPLNAARSLAKPDAAVAYAGTREFS